MRKAFLMVLAISAFGVGCGAGPDGSDKNTNLQASKPTITKPCAADDTFTVWCGYKNPEDLAATPDSKYLLATGFGGIPESTLNEMSLIDLAAATRSVSRGSRAAASQALRV